MGRGLTIAYKMNGELHREDDLPAVTIYDTKGNIQRQEWHTNGYLDRPLSPAVIVYSQTYTEYHWYREGRIYRKDNRPTYVCIKKYTRNLCPLDVTMNVGGNVYRVEEWRIDDGEPVNECITVPKYQEGIPSRITYDHKGYVIEKEWYNIRGEKHREWGPALYEYCDKGTLWRTIYFKNGKVADHGPGLIEYNESGDIINEIFLINGKVCTKEEWEKYNE